MRPFAIVAAAAALAAAVTVSAGPVSAHEYKIGSLEIDHPWTRATPPGAKVAGGFMVIRNAGAEPDRLVSGTSPAGRIELHTMEMSGGVAKMRMLADGIPVPAGETVALAPGGLHVMIVGLTAPIAEDERVPLTLTFEKAGRIEVELVATAPGAPAPPHDTGHGTTGHGSTGHGSAATQ